MLRAKCEVNTSGLYSATKCIPLQRYRILTISIQVLVSLWFDSLVFGDTGY